MKGILAAVLCLGSFGTCAVTTSNANALTTTEQRREKQLKERLCATKQVDCAYVTAIFADPRLEIYRPEGKTHKYRPGQRDRQRNPYLRKRFGLLTDESLQRCRRFLEVNAAAFDAADRTYGVPPAIICGILRIETDFGIPTRLSPNPVGMRPAVNQLVTLYVLHAPAETSRHRFARRQKFALEQLQALLCESRALGWDLFEIPGSPTGAIGLVQFEPTSLDVAVDGDGDGKIDLFDPADAILSVANYLVTRGWDADPEHQQRAIYTYYGGDYRRDSNKYYLRAVLRYAGAITQYLKYHPAEGVAVSTARPF
jgi:membrane-bound lytic murein transglycosylase B